MCASQPFARDSASCVASAVIAVLVGICLRKHGVSAEFSPGRIVHQQQHLGTLEIYNSGSCLGADSGRL